MHVLANYFAKVNFEVRFVNIDLTSFVFFKKLPDVSQVADR